MDSSFWVIVRTSWPSSSSSSSSMSSRCFWSLEADARGMRNSNSLNNGRGKYGYLSPPLRMMQWKRSFATATGQYVSSFRPEARRSRSRVSSNGTHSAEFGDRQWRRTERTPSESKIWGS